ncbi:MAG TPA: hypothetical protein VOA41_19610 [Candidatus Dormibacteraeota bacterium]|nr:hypothetical protein [Candidatus Dormibacteraeota bacterium]
MQRTAFFLLGAVIFVPISQLYAPLEIDSIFIFAGLFFFFVLGLGLLIERRARKRGEVEALKRIYFGFIPLPWLLSGLLFINGYFDRAQPREHRTVVVEKFYMRGLVRGSRRLIVKSWREGQRLERLAVDRDDFDRFERGDEILVKSQPGLVGIPWVYGVYRP